ncbi:MAG: M1 family metallopeptidase [Ignavibacteria bacterium]
MKKHIYPFLTIILFASLVYSQSSLYMPLDIKQAYDKGTRSYDGTPGANYWQNHSVYDIKASIEPKTRLLRGEETIEYFNESPDTLRRIVLRLYQDLFKPGNARDDDLPPEAFTDGVLLEKLRIGDESIIMTPSDSFSRKATNLTIILKEPVLPHSRVNIASSWHFTIPKGDDIRMGTYDSTTFYLAYWYPQVAVYDDIHGWDDVEYKGTLEFYNDFSDYDVEITVPNNFCTWATGVLKNPDRIMTPVTYGKYKLAQSSPEVVKIISQKDLRENNNFASTFAQNTWNYKAENVTDFAFGMSDHYLWDAVSLEVEPGRYTLISAAYNPSSKDFYEIARMSKKIIESYSKDFPAVPFPYPSITIFNGGGGMEYPMMVNEASSETPSGAVYVTAHEIAHSYFPFYMGTNERRWAWMDEGWAQALSFDIQFELAPERDTRDWNVFRYLGSAGKEEDIPMMVPSDNLGRFRSYRSTSYLRPGEAYDMLRNTLGEELFGKCLREYMKRWHGKHPQPYDFFFAFNNAAGDDLSWFWKPWFFEFGYPDLGIKDVTERKGKSKITIEKIGSLPIPVCIIITYEDSTTRTLNETAGVWKSGNSVITVEDSSGKKIKSVKLGNSHIPDVNGENNSWTR